MEFLAGYGSDEEDQDIKQPLKRVKHEDVSGNGVSSAVITGAEADAPAAGLVSGDSRNVRKSKRPALRKAGRGSRWGKASGFLAPISYDKQDVVDEEEEEEEEQDTGVKLTSVGGGRPSLSQYLPAPVHETNDKSDGNIVREPPGSATEREPEVVRPVPTTDEQVGLDIAPAVREWHASAQTRQVHESSDAFAGILPAGVNVKEISGAELRGNGALMGTEGSGMRAALGAEYDNKLRAEAARVGGVSKLAKRKNQLSSLFQSAKSQEIEQMEKQASGIKTKAETQKKYGW